MLNKVKFPEVFLGTNPEGEMQKMGKTGEGEELTIQCTSNSF